MQEHMFLAGFLLGTLFGGAIAIKAMPRRSYGSRATREPRAPKPQLQASPDRGDVVAALQGLGFKKADAARAVDACTPAERASGVESWTRAALSRSQGG